MAGGIKTRTEFVTRALSVLGVLAAGQPPSAEDVELVEFYVDPFMASLPSRGISDTIDVDAIPDELFLPLAVMLADEAVNDFGMARGTPDDPTSFAFKVGQAEARLRSIQASRPTYAPLVADYF